MALQNKVVSDGKKWEQAQIVDVGQMPQVERDLHVKFPDERHGEKTTLHVENPKLEGTPNPYWRISISIRSNGKEIAKPSINSHIQDAALLPGRINEITEHLRDSLESYATAHPEARWKIREDNERLAQLAEHDLQKNPNAVEWTRLDRITNGLNYLREFSVDASAPEDVGSDKVRFSLSIRRGDGSRFMERPRGQSSTAPAERSFTMQRGETPAATAVAIEAFRKNTHATFIKVVENAYDTQVDPTATPENGDKRPEDRMQNYNPVTIVRMLEEASTHNISTQPNPLSIEALPKRTGRGGGDTTTLRPKPELNRHTSFVERLHGSLDNSNLHR